MGQQNPITGPLLVQNAAAKLVPMAGDNQNSGLVSQLHGAKYQQAYRGDLFFGGNQSGATLSAGTATTYTGLCLSNPAASGKNLALRNVSGLLSVAPAGLLALNLMVGWSAAGIVTHTTALTPLPTFLGGITGGAASIAKLDAACTLVGASANAPTYIRPLGTAQVAEDLLNFSVDLEGSIIIPPGGWAAIAAAVGTAPTSGFFGSFEWEEVAP